MNGLAARNRRTGALALLFVAAMGALGFASVPLYRMFCEATGWDGTTRRAEGAAAPGEVVGKIVRVRFDANVKPGMKWRFAPEETVQRVAVGARDMAFFDATNLTDRAVTGHATFNVQPSQAGQYFTKIECFCFKEQTLRAGESVRMPVVFFVDPKMLDDPEARDIDEITLSYTFFPVDSPAAGG